MQVLDTFLQQATDSGTVPGAVVCVACHGQVVENAWAMGGVAGHAGLFATAEDLWHFAHALLETAVGWRSCR